MLFSSGNISSEWNSLWNPIFLILNTWGTDLDAIEHRAPVFRNVTSSLYFSWPHQLLWHFLWTSGLWETRREINTLKPFYFLHHCIYLHKNHLQQLLLSWGSSDSPSGQVVSIRLCWLMLPLANIMEASPQNASHLSFLCPSRSKPGPTELQSSPWPWLALTQSWKHSETLPMSDW